MLSKVLTRSKQFYLHCLWLAAVFKLIASQAYKRFMAWVFSYISVPYHRDMISYKNSLFQTLHDLETSQQRPLTVLEIGVGNGNNFDMYPAGSTVDILDPNIYFKSYSENKRKDFPAITIRNFIHGVAEDMGALETNTYDAVVSTLVMCSTTNPAGALSEIRRVLVPGGKFVYMEHVASENRILRAVQNVMSPVWRRIFLSCNLNRCSAKYIENAGFAEVAHKHFAAPVLPNLIVIKPHLSGVATKGSDSSC